MSRTTDSKKQIILNFINEHYGSYGETPTVRDIAAGTGIAVTSVHRYLSAMKEDGELEYNGRRSVSTRRMEMEQVFAVEMNVVSRGQAAMLEHTFKANAEAVYQTLLTAMTQNYENEKEATKP